MKKFLLILLVGSASANNHFRLYADGTTSQPITVTTVANPMTEIVLNQKSYPLPTNENQVAYPTEDVELGFERFNRFVLGGYGSLSQPDDLTGYLFVQGELIPIEQMPKSGKSAYYTPEGILFWNTFTVPKKTTVYQDGKEVLKVDFSAQTVDFEAYGFNAQNPNDRQELTIRAKINGNTFEGTDNGFLIKGGFFGNDELSGLIQSSDYKTFGLFGAKKE